MMSEIHYGNTTTFIRCDDNVAILGQISQSSYVSPG